MIDLWTANLPAVPSIAPPAGRMKNFTACVAATAATVFLCSFSAVKAATVPAFKFAGDAWYTNATGSVGITTNDFLTYYPGIDLLGSVYNEKDGTSSTVTITNFNSAKLSASATTDQNGLYQAGADVDLEYYFRVSAPAGYNGLASVTVAGNYFVSQSSQYTNADLYICPTDCSAAQPVKYFQANGNGSTAGVLTNYELDFDVTPGIVYQIAMIAEVAEYGPGQSDNAMIDPTISVDPGFQLELSSGIGNGPSATPLPGAFPLFATGLGAMGLLLRRRKRKVAALAA